jgi:hypothetical protein
MQSLSSIRSCNSATCNSCSSWFGKHVSHLNSRIYKVERGRKWWGAVPSKYSSWAKVRSQAGDASMPWRTRLERAGRQSRTMWMLASGRAAHCHGCAEDGGREGGHRFRMSRRRSSHAPAAPPLLDAPATEKHSMESREFDGMDVWGMETKKMRRRCLGFDGMDVRGMEFEWTEGIDVRVVRAAGGRQTRVRGWKGGWAADPRERMEGRTGFFLLFILFSSRDKRIWRKRLHLDPLAYSQSGPLFRSRWFGRLRPPSHALPRRPAPFLALVNHAHQSFAFEFP